MHREIKEDSEIDPMNAPQRTVFFKKSKPAETIKIDFKSNEKSKKIDSLLEKTPEKKLEFNHESLEENENIDEADNKLLTLKKEIETAQKFHQLTKQKLTAKSASLRKTKSTLTQTQKKLDEALSSKFTAVDNNKLEMIGKMSSKMAHDMRNPLTILQSQIELMKVKQKIHEDTVLSNSILSMENALSHITNQINDVLNFIKTPEIRLITCDLKEIVKSSISEVKFPQDVELHSSLNSCVLQCDVVKIRGIVTNIIQNAVQATGLKGRVSISLEVDGEFATIKISDSGSGIPKENIEQIFEPMFTTKDDGTGLGLASCKQYLEMHKGTIHVSNNPTTFTIMLPKTAESS
jgi:signal transduction histidine kinase